MLYEVITHFGHPGLAGLFGNDPHRLSRRPGIFRLSMDGAAGRALRLAHRLALS